MNTLPKRGYREPNVEDLKEEYWYPVVNRVLLMMHPIINRDRVLQRLLERRREALGLKLIEKMQVTLPQQKLEILSGYTPLAREDLLVWEVPVLRFQPPPRPRVSIVVLTWNQWKFTARCLDSLLKFTRDVDYELILVDNASVDETSELFERKIVGATIIRNAENLGFSKACNQGAAVARGEYLLFLNNDVILTPGWLSALLGCAARFPQAGAVGSRIVQMDGRLQEAGVVVWSDGSCMPYGLLGNPSEPAYNFAREVTYCSACSLLVRRDAFEKLGGFDERYSPAYYEDVDLCLGLQQQGLRVMYEPSSLVFHYGSATAGSSRAVELQLKNREKLKQKWADTLRQLPDHGGAPASAVFAARQKLRGKRILFIDDTVPQYDRGSGFPRQWDTLRLLAGAGHHLTFVPYDLEYREPYSSAMQAMGVEVLYGNGSLQTALEERASLTDVAIIARPHNFRRFYQPLRDMGYRHIIYDCEALFHVRLERQLAVLTDEAKKRDVELLFETTKAEEVEAFTSCDAVMAISQGEADIIRSLSPRAHVQVVPPLCAARAGGPGFEERSGVLFVGGFLAGAGSPNEDGVLWMAREVWPLVRQQLGPEVKLFVVGSDPTEAVKQLQGNGIEVVGFAPDLAVWFNQCRVHAVPIRFGAGVKLKLTEGLSYGIPTVATTCGAEGIGLVDGESAYICDEAAAFARRVVDLHQGRDKWLEFSRRSLTLTQELYGEATVLRTLEALAGAAG
jgi:GT2 family glycosyltransferase/glycosyltransferase involved in cell wall biosynthesis